MLMGQEWTSAAIVTTLGGLSLGFVAAWLSTALSERTDWTFRSWRTARGCGFAAALIGGCVFAALYYGGTAGAGAALIGAAAGVAVRLALRRHWARSTIEKGEMP